jgi:hypothetical protein
MSYELSTLKNKEAQKETMIGDTMVISHALLSRNMGLDFNHIAFFQVLRRKYFEADLNTNHGVQM